MISEILATAASIATIITLIIVVLKFIEHRR